MDFSKVSNLTPAERMEIASVMHAVIINTIFARSDWHAPRAIFHGGTAISMQHRSGRFSEDLDFMLNPEARKALLATMERTVRDLNLSMAVQYPGGTVEMDGPRGVSVDAWRLKWSHPMRRDKVTVKAEFFETPEDLLKNYKTVQVAPMDKWNAAVTISSSIPVPELESAWADKIVALGRRAEVKYRDIFDLGFLAPEMRYRKIGDEARANAIATTASIYGAPLREVLDGLGRDMVSDGLKNLDAYTRDMQKWFLQEKWESMRDRGELEDGLRSAAREVEKAIELIENQLSSTPSP